MKKDDWDIQYMVKQGSNWYNMTRNYRAKRKAVSAIDLDESKITQIKDKSQVKSKTSGKKQKTVQVEMVQSVQLQCT